MLDINVRNVGSEGNIAIYEGMNNQVLTFKTIKSSSTIKVRTTETEVILE